jgi:hypothetical protein
MDANERESGTPEETDPLRAYALKNAAREAVQPRPSGSWLVPFLASIVITAVVLAAAYYLWGS